MLSARSNKHDVKSALCKRFGTVFAFEDAVGLPRKSVSDFLRGRSNQRVAAAIDSILAPSGQSDKSDTSTGKSAAHRLNVAAR